MTADTSLVFEEKAPHENGFAAHFDQHIKPRLLEMEAGRIKARRALWTRIAVTAAILVGGAVILYFLYGWRRDYFFWVLGAWLIAIVFMVWFTPRPSRQYALGRKRALIPAVLAFFGEFDYDPRGRISKRVLRDSHLFDDWDDYVSEDLISGTHGGRVFDFAEARLSRTRRKDVRRLFRGYILAMELPEEARGVTIGLRQKGDSFLDFEEMVQRARGLTLVRFPDLDFEHSFEVYSTDFDEARVLISATLSTALDRIGKLHDAVSVEFGINKQVFLLKITSGHDLFDPASLYRTALSTDDTRRVLEEVYLVLAIVDELARGTRIVTNE